MIPYRKRIQIKRILKKREDYKAMEDIKSRFYLCTNLIRNNLEKMENENKEKDLKEKTFKEKIYSFFSLN